MQPDPDAVTRRFDDGTVDLLSLLDLERVEENLYRASCVFAESDNPRTGEMNTLYGGQVAAQALLTAGLTVDPVRTPHSLHGYFLRAGDARLPTVFKVERDRDGRSFSARRVVAIQNGKVIFNMAASFQVRNDAPSEQAEPMPSTEGPDGLDEGPMYRLFSMVARLPEQPYEGTPWPTRFWARVTQQLPDDRLMHACALTYLSDISTGVLPAKDGSAFPGASLDHAVWFHAPADLNDWVLSDYRPRITGQGRGWYTGSLFDTSGRLVASVAQEALFR